MKLTTMAALIITAAFALPVYAQDKPVATEAKTEAKGRPHSHLEERQGIRAEKPRTTAKAKKPLHDHTKEKN
jgi:hypothetical protein